MSLDVEASGLVHVAYAEGDVHLPSGIEGTYNWNKLQAALRWSVVDIAPSAVSLSEAVTKDPNEPAVTLSINVKQLSPRKDNSPLTICTAHTILGNGEPSIRLLMRAKDGPEKYLLGDPLPGVHMRYPEPESDDWKTELPFVTIPPGDQGLTVTKALTWKHLLQYRGKSPSPDKQPQPGDEYKLHFSRGRRETFIDWWNWGDLEGDLKDRKLVNLVDPKLNGVEDPAPPPPPTLLPFEAWGEECDEPGNDFVRLLNILDTTPLVVKFVS